MADKKNLLLVGVCSGNIQRSPTFEAVMDHSLKQEQIDLEGSLIITSAGTNAERYLTHTEAPTRVIEILNAGLQYGVIPEALKQEAKKYAKLCGNNAAIEGLGEQDYEQLRFLHQVVRPALSRRNIDYRNKALERRGIDSSHLISAKPLKPEEGYDIVVAMEKKAYQKVCDRYSGQGQGSETNVDRRVVDIPTGRVVVLGTEKVIVPEIVTYAGFTGKAEVTESTAGGLEGALAHVDYFLDTRSEFFDRIRKRLTK